MAINGTVEIKVTPDVLKQQADEVTNYINTIQQAFETVKRTVEDSRGYWVGEAGDHHRRLFKDQEGDIEEILKRLKEHPDDLQKIAGTYDESERRTKENNSQVPTDLIS